MVFIVGQDLRFICGFEDATGAILGEILNEEYV